MSLRAFLLAVSFTVSPLASLPAASPEVAADGRVTFRLAAPLAREVLVQCETLPPTPLTRGADGVWQATLGPLAPDFYSYAFNVDGLRLLDPRNPLRKHNLLQSDSLLHVPGTAELPWEVADVPHGVLHHHIFRSAVVGEDREFLVYTPPGYDAAGSDRYPVLYLLHGFSDDASTWSTVGRANVILDHLLARGAVPRMLVVMPLGYGDRRVLDDGWDGPARARHWEENQVKFRELLVTEILPQVERAYRTRPGREARAIAGLSMGGMQALRTGLNEPERFAWIGAFSAGQGDADLAATYPRVTAKLPDELRPRLLWLACGEQDERLETNRRRVAWFTEHGLVTTWQSTPGTHSFLVWRRYLAAFLPQLFRESARN